MVEEELINMPEENQQPNGPRIRRATVDSLNFYEVTEEELTIFEHGSPSSLYLNLSIVLLSVAISFFATLVTTKTPSIYLFTIFVVITVLGFILGMCLLILWFREYRTSTSTSKKVRSRMKEEILNEEIKGTLSDPTSTLGNDTN